MTIMAVPEKKTEKPISLAHFLCQQFAKCNRPHGIGLTLRHLTHLFLVQYTLLVLFELPP